MLSPCGEIGKPYSRGFNGENNLQRYSISHTKEIESGCFQKRAQAFLDAVPVEKAVHLTISLGQKSGQTNQSRIAIGARGARRSWPPCSNGPGNGPVATRRVR